MSRASRNASTAPPHCWFGDPGFAEPHQHRHLAIAADREPRALLERALDQHAVGLAQGQLLDPLAGREVRELGVEQREQDRERLVGVAHVVRGRVRGRERQRDPSLGIAAIVLGPATELVDERLEPIELTGEAHGRVEGVLQLVGRRLVDQLHHGLERPVRVTELLVAYRRQLAQAAKDLVGIGGQPGPGRDHGREIRPATVVLEVWADQQDRLLRDVLFVAELDEVGDGPLLPGQQLQDLLVTLDGAQQVLERAGVEPRGVEHQAGLALGRGRDRRPILDDVGRLGVAALGEQRSGQRRHRVVVGRGLAEQRPQDLDLGLAVLGRLAVDAGQLHSQRAALLTVVAGVDPAIEHLDQFGGRSARGVGPAQALERLDVVGLDLEQPAPGLLGLRQVREHVLVQGREPTQEVDPMPVVALDLDPTGQDLAQLFMIAEPNQGPVHQLERVLLVVAQGQGPAQDLDGDLGRVLAADPSRPDQHLEPAVDVVGQVRTFGPSDERVGQGPRHLERAGEPANLGVEGHQGVGRSRLEQGPREGPERVLGPVGDALEVASQLAVELVAGRGILGDRQPPLGDRDQPRGVAGRLVDRLEDVEHALALRDPSVGDPLERGDGVGLVEDLVEQGLERVEGPLTVVERPVLELGDHQVDRRAVVRVDDPGQAIAQQLEQLGPALGHLVDLLELGPGAVVVGLGVEDPAERLGPDRGLVEHVERDPRQPHQQLDLALLVEAVLGLAPVRVGQLAPHLAHAQGRLELAKHAAVVGPALEQALVEGDRLGRLAQRAGPQLGRLVDDLEHRVGVVVGVGVGVLGQDLGVAIGRRQHVREPAEVIADPGVGRVLLEHARVGVEGLLEILELLLLHPSHAQHDLDAVAVVLGLVEPDLLDLEQALPVLDREEHRLEHRGRAAAHRGVLQVARQLVGPDRVVGVGLERGAEVTDALLGILEVAAIEPTEAQVGVDRGLARQLPEPTGQVGRELAEPTGLFIQRLEHGLDVLALEAGVGQPLVQTDGLLVVVELVAMDIGRADQQVVALGRGHGPIDLANQEVGERPVGALAHVDLLEGVGRLVVVGPGLEQALVDAAGVVEPAQPRERDHTHRTQDSLLEIGVEDVIDGPLVRGPQRLAALRDRAEALDLVEDLGELGLVAGLGHRFAQDREGPGRILELLLLGHGHPKQGLEPTATAGLLAGLELLQLEQRRPVLFGLVKRGQDPDRPLAGLVGLEVAADHRARAAVGRRRVEHALEQVEGVVRAPEPLADDVGGLGQESDPLGVGVSQRESTAAGPLRRRASARARG